MDDDVVVGIEFDRLSDQCGPAFPIPAAAVKGANNKPSKVPPGTGETAPITTADASPMKIIGCSCVEINKLIYSWTW